MDFSLEVKTPLNEIVTNIFNEMRDYLTKVLRKSKDDIDYDIRAYIEASILGEPEAHELISGRLRDDFGIESPEPIVKEIAKAVANTLKIKTIPMSATKGGFFRGGYEISFSRQDFSEALGVEGTTYTSNGHVVPWLEWLLFKGNEIIIVGYMVKYKGIPTSRSGSAFMARAINGKYKVPSEYAGTEEDNWITRALRKSDSVLNKIIKDNINANLH